MAFLAVSVLFPEELREVRLALLLVTVVLVLMGRSLMLMSGLASVLTPIVFLVMASGIFAALVGAIQSNTGYLPVTRVFVVWPALLFIACISIQTLRELNSALRLLDVMTVIVSIVVLVIGSIGFSSSRIELGPLGRFAVDTNGVEVVTALTLIFLLPYAIARLAWANRSCQARWWIVSALGASLGFAAGLRSGQRSILLAAAVGLIGAIIWALYFHRVKSYQARLFRLAATFIGIALLFVCILSIGSQFYSISLSTLESESIRTDQAAFLFQRFLEAPVFGHGLGFAPGGLVRNATTPWSYEVLPALLLATHGAVGTALLLAAGVLTARALMQSRTALGDAVVVPVTLGVVSVLLASVANPVVTKLGMIWMLFIPIVVINVAERCRDSNTPRCAVTGNIKRKWKRAEVSKGPTAQSLIS
jgi:hypothetical protein